MSGGGVVLACAQVGEASGAMVLAEPARERCVRVVRDRVFTQNRTAVALRGVRRLFGNDPERGKKGVCTMCTV